MLERSRLRVTREADAVGGPVRLTAQNHLKITERLERLERMVAVVSHAIGSAPDAVNDTLWLECDLEQVREVLAAATHVGIQVQLATAADECVFYFERAEPFQPRSGLTTDYIG